MIKQGWRYGLWLLLWIPGLALAVEVGLVTALSGSVGLDSQEQGAPKRLQAFSKLHEGDRLKLEQAVRLQLVFFQSGAEQVWQGPGDLRIGADGAESLTAGLQAQVRQLPRVLVKQLARTPAADGQIKAGMVRLRTMPSGGTLESVENNYAELRRKAAATDRNPELYLLAGYFELREFAKLQQLLARLDEQSPGNHEVAVLRSLYVRAMNNAKMAEEQ